MQITLTSKGIFFLLVCFEMFVFQSCRKYDEGPVLSLRSRTERVANTWKISKYKKNDKDLTSLYKGYMETFTKDGNYSYTWENIAGTGKWSFQNDDNEIAIVGIHNQSNQKLHLLKLEEKEFWFYYMDGEDKKEFHMVAN